MFIQYDDIISKLGEPLWFSKDGYPRYCKYIPSECGVYHKFSALCLVKCQACGKEFKIGTATNLIDIWYRETQGHIDKNMTELEKIRYVLEYSGDPPNVDCCAAGPTMTVEFVSFLEMWKINDKYLWEKMDV